MESGKTNTILNEALTIHTEKEFTMTKTCKNGSGIVRADWKINGTTKFTLPITCTLSSPEMDCGYVSIVGEMEEDIKIQPARMIIFNEGPSEEEKAQISDSEWTTEVSEVTHAQVGGFSIGTFSGLKLKLK